MQPLDDTQHATLDELVFRVFPHLRDKPYYVHWLELSNDEIVPGKGKIVCLICGEDILKSEELHDSLIFHNEKLINHGLFHLREHNLLVFS